MEAGFAGTESPSYFPSMTLKQLLLPEGYHRGISEPYPSSRSLYGTYKKNPENLSPRSTKNKL